MSVGAFLIFMVSSGPGIDIYRAVPGTPADRGQSDLSACGGYSVGLPSIWVLAAVSIGGSLMGIVGMLIFIPLMSVFYALFREVVYIKLRQKRFIHQDIG